MASVSWVQAYFPPSGNFKAINKETFHACITHILQFAFAIFAKSFIEQIAKEELSIISTIWHGLLPKFSKKLWNMGGSPSTALRATSR
jgi:hypothetical protein